MLQEDFLLSYPILYHILLSLCRHLLATMTNDPFFTMDGALDGIIDFILYI